MIYILELNKIYNEDCIGENGIKLIDDNSIDMVLCDLPYGTTACKWDTVIDFEKLWEQYKRIVKPTGAIVLTASQPFTTALIASNYRMFKYSWVWDKKAVSNPQLAKIQPLKCHEDIVVFGKGRIKYLPQGLEDFKGKSHQGKSSELNHIVRDIGAYKQLKTNYPKSIQYFKQERGLHPTQKPVALFEYLVRTYTNEGDVILDNCMGSGTTAIASINANRKFIGFENNKEYFDIANERIRKHINNKNMIDL